MELIVAVIALVVVAVLATRFGHDSRDGLHATERAFAAQGLTGAGRREDEDLAAGMRHRRLIRPAAAVDEFVGPAPNAAALDEAA